MEDLGRCQGKHLTVSYLSSSKTREQQRRLTGFVHIKVLDWSCYRGAVFELENRQLLKNKY